MIFNNSKNNIMKKLFLIIGCIISLQAFPQFGVTIYNTTAMGIGVPMNKKVFGEIKAYSNMYLSSMRMEADICYNIRRTKTLNIYAGIGAVTAPFDQEFKSISVPLGLQVSPFENLPNLSFVLELAPEIYEDVYIRSLWGIRFNFIKKAS
jgi:hypothetical protein